MGWGCSHGCPRSAVSSPSFLDGKGAGEKKYIFSADSFALDPGEALLHQEHAPSSLADLAGLATGGVFGGESFAVVGNTKDELLGGRFHIDPNRTWAGRIGVKMNIG